MSTDISSLGNGTLTSAITGLYSDINTLFGRSGDMFVYPYYTVANEIATHHDFPYTIQESGFYKLSYSAGYSGINVSGGIMRNNVLIIASTAKDYVGHAFFTYLKKGDVINKYSTSGANYAASIAKPENVELVKYEYPEGNK